MSWSCSPEHHHRRVLRYSCSQRRVTQRASSLPAGFTDTTSSRPDRRPWDSVGGEDDRMFVWKRTGRVWLLGGPQERELPLDLCIADLPE